MGMIALAASKPGMEQRLGVSFDEIPSARLRSYAESELPKHFGISRPRMARARSVKPLSFSKPAKIKPQTLSQFNGVPAPTEAEVKARTEWNSAGEAHYKKRGETPRAVMFLDSGAFSVWSRGANITFDDYAEFLDLTKDYVDYAFNLDVLPGALGRPATRAEGELTAELGMKNWRELRKRGHEVIHTYHEGEPIEQLLRIRDEALAEMKVPFLALSPLATSGRATRWFTECWKHLVDEGGYPLLKVHGLGVLEHEGVTSFPWESVDGTTWLNGSIFGTICDWVMQHGKQVLRQLVITLGLKDGRNGWYSMTTAEREQVSARVFNCTPDEVPKLESREWGRRISAFNLKAYKRLETMIPDRLNVGPQPRKLV